MPDHLAGLGSPTRYARFRARVMTDPALHEIMAEESPASPALRWAIEGLDRAMPETPPEVRAERGRMVRVLLIPLTCAERERALAEGSATPRAGRSEAVTGLADAIGGLWPAPVSPARRRPLRRRDGPR